MIHLITSVSRDIFYPRSRIPKSEFTFIFIFCNFAAEIKGCFNRLRLYPMNLEQVMLFRELKMYQ